MTEENQTERNDQLFDIVAVQTLNGASWIVEEDVSAETAGARLMEHTVKAVSGEYGGGVICIARVEGKSPREILTQFVDDLDFVHGVRLVELIDDDYHDLGDMTEGMTETTLINDFVERHELTESGG